MKRAGGMVFLLAAVSSSAFGQLFPVDQQRFVSALGTVLIPENSVSDDQSDTAPDFGPFSSSREVHLALGFSRLDAQAQQDSQIAPAIVSMSGFAEMAATSGFSGETVDGEAHSYFSLTFDLVQDEMWNLDAAATGQASGGALGNALLQLTNNSMTIAELNSDMASRLHVGLLLPAGEYVLTAEADASGSATFFGSPDVNAQAAIDFTFQQVPEPGTWAIFGLAGMFLARRRVSKRR